eukprot:COSAG01_NODE_1382_length_10521_cov_61.545001_6_plen_256_part_00
MLPPWSWAGGGAEAWDAEMLERERPSDNHPASSMFAVAEKVLAFDTHGAVFWSKVLQRRKGTMLVGSTIARDNDALDQAKWHYKIHYMGWGARWDDWLDNRRIYKGSEEMASLLKQESGMGSGQFAILSEQEHKERLAAERVERLQRLAAARSASRNGSRKAKSNAAIQKQQREQKIIGSTLNRLVKSVERQARQEQPQTLLRSFGSRRLRANTASRSRSILGFDYWMPRPYATALPLLCCHHRDPLPPTSISLG